LEWWPKTTAFENSGDESGQLSPLTDVLEPPVQMRAIHGNG
jgi:hypothetical protein